MTFPPTVQSASQIADQYDPQWNRNTTQDNGLIANVIALQNAIANGTMVKRTFQFKYRFSVNGGAVASIPLTAVDGAIPANFVIQSAWLDVLTALTSGGSAEAALTSGIAANDLISVAVISGAPWSTTGRKVTIPLFATISTWLKTVTAETPELVVSVAALTAGSFNLFLEGYVSAA